ncbi:anti-sigma regulatory factor [Oscillatoria sp. FACHB-1406]|uniref:ATP-binding protein n=1 Tax=Oscillatoria sp. FACHB-1406 TaxID=2692846 RepID=UPI001685907C|nr:anti-sigma regulatory factor [Oscillatoria sp. FACHB-1406]MBD2577322.1 ATP-binding protein [Oscillatoria sp. FACHB-1406]
MNFPKKSLLTVPTKLDALSQVLSWFDSNRQLMPQKDWLQCQLALAEAFTNAVRHAHKGLSEDTPIELEVLLYPTSIELRIWDRGAPFDLEGYIKTLDEQPNYHSGGQRGLILMKSIADRLSYRRVDEQRNCLLLVKTFEVSSP